MRIVAVIFILLSVLATVGCYFQEAFPGFIIGAIGLFLILVASESKNEKFRNGLGMFYIICTTVAVDRFILTLIQ